MKIPTLTDRQNYEEQRLRSHRHEGGGPIRKQLSPRVTIHNTVRPFSGISPETKAKRKTRITLPKVFK